MNLSRVKRVGFINDFQRNGSYPQFGYKESTPVIAVPQVETVDTEMVKPISQVAKVKSIAAHIARRIISREQSAFKKEFGSNYRGRLIN